MYVCMFVYVCMYMYACMHACMYCDSWNPHTLTQLEGSCRHVLHVRLLCYWGHSCGLVDHIGWLVDLHHWGSGGPQNWIGFGPLSAKELSWVRAKGPYQCDQFTLVAEPRAPQDNFAISARAIFRCLPVLEGSRSETFAACRHVGDNIIDRRCRCIHWHENLWVSLGFPWHLIPA